MELEPPRDMVHRTEKMCQENGGIRVMRDLVLAIETEEFEDRASETLREPALSCVFLCEIGIAVGLDPWGTEIIRAGLRDHGLTLGESLLCVGEVLEKEGPMSAPAPLIGFALRVDETCPAGDAEGPTKWSITHSVILALRSGWLWKACRIGRHEPWVVVQPPGCTHDVCGSVGRGLSTMARAI
jgi:hypothetical protein